MQLDIKQLVVFVTVTKKGSFLRAAGSLGMAQATVSESVASLERKIGARLLNRLGRKIELTDAGELLIKRAEEIIALGETTQREMLALLGRTGGRVRLGGSTAPGEYRIPRLLKGFSMQHPDITVCLTIGDSEMILGELESGRLDMGVIGKTAPGDTFISKRTWGDSLVLTVNPDHAFAKKRKPVAADDIAKEDWIFRETGSATRTLTEKFLKKSLRSGTKSLKVIAELGSTTAMKEGIKAGLGIALMSKATIEPELKNGTLKTVKVDGLFVERNFYLVRDKRRDLSVPSSITWEYILASHSSIS